MHFINFMHFTNLYLSLTHFSFALNRNYIQQLNEQFNDNYEYFQVQINSQTIYKFLKQMLIPDFKLTQDDDFIIVSIRLPYVKVTACEFYIDLRMFKFYLKPYLLTLNFQQDLKPSEQPYKAVYNHDKFILIVYLEKNVKKQYFQNLNLLSNILSNKKSEKTQKGKQTSVLIEVVSQSSQESGKIVETEQQASSKTKNQYAYGFCGNYQNVFKNLQDEVIELFSFDPKDVSINQRYELQQDIDYEQFDQDGYFYDKMSNYQEIDRIVQSKQALQALYKLVKEYFHKSQVDDDYDKFKSQLKIPNKQILVAKSQHQHIWKQLFSIAFCYIYELICMEGEMGVESAKTINKTNPLLSANVLFEHLQLRDLIIDCSRKCIVYSLYKHLDICKKVVDILRQQLTLQMLIAILADLRFMFQKSDPRYLLNTIYLNDFCIYLMHGGNDDKKMHLKEVKEGLKQVTVREQDLKLDISQQQGDMLGCKCEGSSQEEEKQVEDKSSHQQKEQQKQSMVIQKKKIAQISDTFQQLLDLD